MAASDTRRIDAKKLGLAREALEVSGFNLRILQSSAR